MSTTIAIVGRGGQESDIVDIAVALTQHVRELGGTVLRSSTHKGKSLYDTAGPDPAATEHVRGLEGGTHHYPGKAVISIVAEGGRHRDYVEAVASAVEQLEGVKVRVDEALVEGHGLQTYVRGEAVHA